MAAIIPLATLLLPLIPGLVQSVTGIIQAIRDHASTPDAAKAQLDAIAVQLEDIKGKVAAVRV